MSPVQIVVDGKVSAPSVQAAMARLTQEVAQDPAFGPVQTQTAKAGDLALLSVPVNGDSVGTLALNKVRELRGALIPKAFNGSGASVYVTGQTAGNLDYINIVNSYFPWVVALVLSLSFLLLLIAFRSIVIPLKAILMNLLSVGAAYGLVTLVSLKGWGAGVLGFQQVPVVEQWVPLLLFAVLFGLSMDYQVFLLSRIKEAWDRTGDNTLAVTEGIGATAGIITGAALIMVAVFAGFAAGDLVMFQQMGFGLAVAVLLDATLIRTILVPSAMKLLGRWNWYLPSWLEWLPHLSIEGAPRRLPRRRRGRRDRNRRAARASSPCLPRSAPPDGRSAARSGRHPRPEGSGRWETCWTSPPAQLQRPNRPPRCSRRQRRRHAVLPAEDAAMSFHAQTRRRCRSQSCGSRAVSIAVLRCLLRLRVMGSGADAECAFVLTRQCHLRLCSAEHGSAGGAAPKCTCVLRHGRPAWDTVAGAAPAGRPHDCRRRGSRKAGYAALRRWSSLVAAGPLTPALPASSATRPPRSRRCARASALAPPIRTTAATAPIAQAAAQGSTP